LQSVTTTVELKASRIAASKYSRSIIVSFGGTALLSPGDHVCAIYASETELAETAGEFLADGLRKSERCWYLPAADEASAVLAAIDKRRVDTTGAIARGALRILSSDAAYAVRGDFDPEETLSVFSGAIEEALSDGFNGFRAAANMSWALALANGLETVVTYEALLRSLFMSARATGLCLYDRHRMPIAVIDGALATHPIVRCHGSYHENAFYDAGVQSLPAADPLAVNAKLAELGLASAERPDEQHTRARHDSRRK
jgi:hypothetical protein